MANRERLAILVGPRGRGSNMAALIEACQSGRVTAEPYVVVSPNADSSAASNAASYGIRVEVVLPGEEYGSRMLAALGEATVVCLAGYTRLLPSEVLAAFPGRVLNIHPALLPKFGGKGMYGRYVHEAVVSSGETESGCTVHLVTEHYDEGDIVLQARCDVHPDDTPETLADRVLALEHKTYPEALQKVLSGG